MRCLNIYVGNISRAATEQELREAFQAFGAVRIAAVIKNTFSFDSFTGLDLVDSLYL